jgi:hypothetical protein
MKISKNIELPITRKNLAWRVFAPLTVLEMLGFTLDRVLHLHRFFKVSLALLALSLTIWGISVTIREFRTKNLL